MNARVKNIIVILILLVLLVLLLSACDKEVVIGHKTLSFSGFVTDSITGMPVDSAIISLNDSINGAIWFTDSSGYYIGVGFPGSQIQTFYVQKTSYDTQSRNIVLNRNLTNINFKMIPDSL